MPEGNHHLTYEQRWQIGAFLQAQYSQAEIARQIGVDRSTISRELQRNGDKAEYSYQQAHKKSVERRKKASTAPRKMTFALVEIIENLLENQQWSPDQISGWLKRADISISHEWIYRHVWADKKKGGDLWTHLRPFHRPIAGAI